MMGCRVISINHHNGYMISLLKCQWRDQKTKIRVMPKGFIIYFICIAFHRIQSKYFIEWVLWAKLTSYRVISTSKLKYLFTHFRVGSPPRRYKPCLRNVPSTVKCFIIKISYANMYWTLSIQKIPRINQTIFIVSLDEFTFKQGRIDIFE